MHYDHKCHVTKFVLAHVQQISYIFLRLATKNFEYHQIIGSNAIGESSRIMQTLNSVTPKCNIKVQTII